MAHKSRMDNLSKRAYACGADENLRDAWSDLVRWPEHGKRIMDDLEHIIKSYEEERYGTQDVSKV